MKFNINKPLVEACISARGQTAALSEFQQDFDYFLKLNYVLVIENKLLL